MPVGEIVAEFIAEIVLRPVATVVTRVFGALGYLTGTAFLTILTFGRLQLAPLDSLFEGGRFDKRRKLGLGLWMEQPGKRRALKAGWVCLVGLLLWIVIGTGVYQVMKWRQARSEAGLPVASGEC